ncbi:MAG: hypothetical protein QXH30_01045 [Candidatus Bilamarchaeaceae archaeon]
MPTQKDECMPRKVKENNPLLSMVPVRAESPEEQIAYKKTEGACPCIVSEFSLGRISNSIAKAEGMRHHYSHIHHAEKAVNLQHKWESLPIYHEGDYFPKRQLYTNFKRVLQDVFENKKA